MRIVLSVEEGPHCGETFCFDQHDVFIVGRGAQAHFKLPKKDRYFSRVHFLIEMNPPHCRLVDLKSRNGTLVNGQRVSTAELKDGDLIQGGQTAIRVSFDHPASVSEPEPLDFPQPPKPELPHDAAEKRSHPTPPPAAALAPSSQGPGDPVTPLCDSNAPPSPAPPILPPDFEALIRQRPQPVSGYWIVDEIGRGGVGVVYRAVRRSDEAVVALKTILPARKPSDTELQCFIREAEIQKQLCHPNIVTLYELGESNGLLFVSMQYIPGIDAEKALTEQGPFSISRVVELGGQLLDALHFAHQKGFVHRDVKPQNLLLTTVEGRETVKLTDFGLARCYQTSQMSGLTVVGQYAGTPPFMPPEQIVDFRGSKPTVDQYAAAATLYRLLTGRYIYKFPPDDPIEQLRMILCDDPVPLQNRRYGIPNGLAAAIERALSRDPDDRFADMAEFRRAILQEEAPARSSDAGGGLRIRHALRWIKSQLRVK